MRSKTKAGPKKQQADVDPWREILADPDILTRRTPADLETDDIASDGDAAWFLANPGERMRARHPIQGEFSWATPPGCDCYSVLVLEVTPGVRARGPLFRPLAPSEVN